MESLDFKRKLLNVKVKYGWCISLMPIQILVILMHTMRKKVKN